MSSVDTRYQEIWKNVQVYNRTKNDLWLDLIENLTYSDDPVEAAAAHKMLSRYAKDRHDTATG
jgi:hypothetical protein